LTTLGPLSTAVGSGTRADYPALVRNGEVVIFDSNGDRVYGGYAVKFSDQTDRTTIYTKIECHDYWQALDRVLITEVFTGVTDLEIITALLKKHAPWVDRSLIPTRKTAFFFSLRRYRNETLLKALQSIIDITGYTAWIDNNKRFHYVAPTENSSAPFGLSNTPNFRTTMQFGVDSYEQDDTAAINRVYFHGGKRPSEDFEQDLSTQANGRNDTFVLAYYPRIASDGKIHVYVNGTELQLGYSPGAEDQNKLIREGGTAEVLVNPDALTLTFNTPPAAGSTVSCVYRYQLPLVLVVTDEKSRRYYGQYLDGSLSNDTVFDPQIAIQRARVLLYEQAYGLVSLKVRCWRAGLRAGQIIRVDHSIRGIHGSFLIQSVDTKPLGGGVFEYTLQLGSWNWDLADVVMMLMARTQPTDEATEEEETLVVAQEAYEELGVQFSLSYSAQVSGHYYATDVALHDGGDAYAGFSSI
jgi:hypothetical protein